PAGKGTGLGLSTVWDLVRNARGHVRVESEVGRGTTFRVYLPKVEAGHPEAVPDTSGEHRLRGAETVLVADDDAPVRALVTHGLRARGYTVLSAGSPAEAVALAQDHPGALDAVVCESRLPGGCGRELARRLRAARPDLVVLLVSGSADASGGDLPFLAKPFTPAVLAARLRKLLDRR
ncbi:MAG: response regulator, partial [Gemmataceae bacterium]|nr:response regulator [Gemmataceae bacterium]